MTITTRFTELVGCSVPIQCAGMGMASTKLAVEIARGGGLGMFSGVMMSPEQLESSFSEVRANTVGAIGINFIIPFLEDRTVIDIAANNAQVVEFFYGEPERALVDQVHSGKALACWQVGSVNESLAAVEAGCDFIVLQGSEAGGHVRGKRALFTMLADVLDLVDCPVVVAGGIATPRAVAMALAAGAAGVRIGTRFVATPESGYHADYINALIQAEAEDTVYTEQFSVGWPDAPHRVLSNSIEEAKKLPDGTIGKADVYGEIVDVPRFSVFGAMETTTGNLNAMPHYAGQGVSAIKSCEPAAKVLQDLAEGAEALLQSDLQRLNKLLQ